MSSNPKKSRRVEITVALIGLAGVLGGAVIANWDKIVGSKVPDRAIHNPVEEPPPPQQDDASEPSRGATVAVNVKKPDLVVSSVGIDKTHVERVTRPWTWINYEVKNIGNASTAGGFIFARSWKDGEPTSGDMALDGPIAPGDSVKYRFAVGHDESWKEGRHRVQVEVDYKNLIDELDEGNNQSDTVDFLVTSP